MTPPGQLADRLRAARVRPLWIGEVVCMFVDRAVDRTSGLEVAGAGRTRGFLPWVAAHVGAGGISVSSTLLAVSPGAATGIRTRVSEAPVARASAYPPPCGTRSPCRQRKP